MATDHLQLYPDRRAHKARRVFTERETFEWLVRDGIGRQFLWKLIEESKVLAKVLQNHTATAQAGVIAVRDFGMGMFLQPLLTHCPRAFVEMTQEESDDGHATNTN